MKLFLSYRYLLLFLLISAGHAAAAQDDATSKFLDSLKMPAPFLHDTMSAPVTDSAVTDQEASYEDDKADIPVDTAIISSVKRISTDSLARIKKDRGFYYQDWLDSLLRADDARVKLRKDPVKPLDLSFLDTFFAIFKVILWVLAAAVLFFVVYKLFLGKSALFLQSRKNIETVIDIEEEEAAAGRYERLIKKAEAEKNYRLAVRYLYLQALNNLSQNGYIRMGSEKTNYQYAGELRKSKPSAGRAFADLTNKYEYVWYGEYIITAPMYDALRAGFTEFNNETARY
ncbi:MAG: DUF4129 domain-containing protein [Chitinophagaceae bacterium]